LTRRLQSLPRLKARPRSLNLGFTICVEATRPAWPAAARAAIAAGRDPAGEKTAGKEAARKAVRASRDSVEAVVAEFIEKHVRPSNKPSTAKEYERLGVDLHVVERCLNHASGSFGGIVGTYQKHKFEDGMRRAMDAWALHIEALAAGRAAASNVIEIGAKTRA
jgi:hypothetical protein